MPCGDEVVVASRGDLGASPLAEFGVVRLERDVKRHKFTRNVEVAGPEHCLRRDVIGAPCQVRSTSCVLEAPGNKRSCDGVDRGEKDIAWTFDSSFGRLESRPRLVLGDFVHHLIDRRCFTSSDTISVTAEHPKIMLCRAAPGSAYCPIWRWRARGT